MTDWEKTEASYNKINWENEIKLNILAEDTFYEKEKINELAESIVDNKDFIMEIIVELAYIGLIDIVNVSDNSDNIQYKVNLEALEKYKNGDELKPSGNVDNIYFDEGDSWEDTLNAWENN